MLLDLFKKKPKKREMPKMKAKAEAEITVRRPDGSLKAFRHVKDGKELKRIDN